MTRRGNSRHSSHRSAHKSDHRQVRRPKRRVREFPKTERLTVCLWALSGELVVRYDASGTVQRSPSVNVWEGVRYELMKPHPATGRIVHYMAVEL